MMLRSRRADPALALELELEEVVYRHQEVHMVLLLLIRTDRRMEDADTRSLIILARRVHLHPALDVDKDLDLVALVLTDLAQQVDHQVVDPEKLADPDHLDHSTLRVCHHRAVQHTRGRNHRDRRRLRRWVLRERRLSRIRTVSSCEVVVV
jgi:hypothetical protein